MSCKNSVKWRGSPWVLVAQWIERPSGVLKVMGSNPIGTQNFSRSHARVFLLLYLARVIILVYIYRAAISPSLIYHLTIICCTTEQVRGMGLFLVWHHKLHCMHVYKGLLWCKSACRNIKPGIDPSPLLAQSLNRWWLDFVTFTVYKKVKI